jgi:hypothetical protein
MKVSSCVQTDKSSVRTKPCNEVSWLNEFRLAIDRTSQVVENCSIRSNGHRPSIDRASRKVLMIETTTTRDRSTGTP